MDARDKADEGWIPNSLFKSDCGQRVQLQGSGGAGDVRRESKPTNVHHRLILQVRSSLTRRKIFPPFVKSRAVRCKLSSKHRRHSGLPRQECQRKSSIPHSASSASRIGYDDWSDAQTNPRSPRFAHSGSPRPLMPAPTNSTRTHAGAVGLASESSFPPAKHP